MAVCQPFKLRPKTAVCRSAFEVFVWLDGERLLTVVAPETPEQHALRFPKLAVAQIAQLRSSSKPRHVKAGEILFNQETAAQGIFVVVTGCIEIVGVSNGAESILSVLGSGEITQLSGRRSLVLCQACEDSELLEIDGSTLRHVMQTDAVLGTTFLRAFLLRRAFLIASSIGDAVLIGSRLSGDTLRLRTFLGRNGHPYTYLDVDVDADIQVVLDQFSVQIADIPVLICRGQLVLRNPSNAETAACFGLNAGIDHHHRGRFALSKTGSPQP
jgi:thioredoxin reductase (NADPH)